MTGRPLDLLGPADRSALRERCGALLEQDETQLGAALIGSLPTHEARSENVLREWSAIATEFGAELAQPGEHPDIDELAAGFGLRVVHSGGGVTPTRLTLAQYASRPPTVRIFDDTLLLAQSLVDLLDWQGWFPAGRIRDAAVCHEVVHRLLSGAPGDVLKKRLGHVAFRLGPVVFRGHVLGADEVAAHSFARVRCRLPKSPLLLTAALAEASDFLDFGRAPLVHSGKEV
jgi:hypothetical protein